MEQIKLAIIDDDYLIVELLKDFFDKTKVTSVVYDGTDGNDFFVYLDGPHAGDIDVLLLDLKMKSVNGLEILKYIRAKYPKMKIIVISSHYQGESIGFMTKEGASAFLPKGMSPFELLDIIKHVDEKGIYLSKGQIDILREQISIKAPKPTVLDDEHLLTEREIQIVKLFCQQKTAKEIGETLFITPRTVEGHKNNVFMKIGVRNISGLIVYALQQQIVSLEELSFLAHTNK